MPKFTPLSAEDYAQIRAQTDRVPAYRLAKQYHVSPARVRKIQEGKELYQAPKTEPASVGRACEGARTSPAAGKMVCLLGGMLGGILACFLAVNLLLVLGGLAVIAVYSSSPPVRDFCAHMLELP